MSQGPQTAERNHPASSSRSIQRSAMSIWATAHARCLFESLGRMQRGWVASLLTVLVIGVALALPAGLYVLLKNLDTLSASWHQSVQISIYLKHDLSDEKGQALADRLKNNTDVAATHFISASEGLAEFKKASHFGAALDALSENPLPGVVEVTPKAKLPPAAVGDLVKELGQLDGVDHAALDQAWLRRLTAILDLISRASWVIGILLSVAVLFIVGNTIRLDIENRRREIQVMKLLGAPDSFIRRPFLYSGIWYGLFGATFALITLFACYLALGSALHTLTASYDNSFVIHGLTGSEVLFLLLGGIGLGWLGCAITVNRRLADIEPR